MNSDYWEERAQELADEQFEKTDNLIELIKENYEEVLQSIQKDMDEFYERFSVNNEISLKEAKRVLNSSELKEFKMDLKDFIRKAKNNLNGKWERELNNVSYRVRITRLQALEIQIKNRIEELYTEEQTTTKNHLKDIYKDTYYRNIYEIHKGLGTGISFARIDDKAIEKILLEKWYEGNYSSRVWKNKELLISELQKQLTIAFTKGESIKKTSKKLAERMRVARSRATTLINTESSYITHKATLDGYKASGVVRKYQILATLDLRTSEICRYQDGKVYELSKKIIGINAPPFHPNCRSTTIPWFDDDVEEYRIARDNQGNSYYVDGSMKYQEWYDEYVKNNPKELIAEKKLKNKYRDKEQHKKYKEALGKEVPKSFDKFQDMKYNNVKEWDKIKQLYSDTNSGKVWLKAEFPTEKSFNRHYDKHLNEYGDISKEEYLGIARSLLSSPVKENIEGFKSDIGFIFRYNKITNDLAIGRADGKISTLFKPDKKLEYWEEQIELYKNKEE